MKYSHFLFARFVMHIVKRSLIWAVLFSCTAWAGKPSDEWYSAPRLNSSWKVIGPGGGGMVWTPQVSPHDPKTVLVGCDMDQVFITHDGGESWRMINLRDTTRFYVFDPIDPKIMYVKCLGNIKSVGLWRSKDGGETWNLLHPKPSEAKKIIFRNDDADEAFEGSSDSIYSLAIDPQNSKVLYAIFKGSDGMDLRISRDDGETWKSERKVVPSLLFVKSKKPEAEGEFNSHQIYIDPRSPKDDRTIYILGDSASEIRKGGKWSSYAIPSEAQRFINISAAFSPKTGNLMVYAVAPIQWGKDGSTAGIYVSQNGGENWNPVKLGKEVKPSRSLETQSQSLKNTFFHYRFISACQAHPETAYLSFRGLQFGDRSEETSFGIFKTSDGGKNWETVWKQVDETRAPLPSNVHDDGWIMKMFGGTFGPDYDNINWGVCVAPSNPDICYTSDEGRVMRTTDGGKNWYQAYAKTMPDGTSKTTGLDEIASIGIHFDPFDKDRIFSSNHDVNLFRSENGGKSWIRGELVDMPLGWVSSCYWVVIDPKVKDRLWAVMGRPHDLPTQKELDRKDISLYEGGVALSEDGGKTWRKSNAGMPETTCTHMILDPASPADKYIFYVTGFGKGVFKSTDSGKTWTLKNNGIDDPQPFAWRLAQDSDRGIYLVTARKGRNGNDGKDGALYYSKDGADHWEKVPLPKGVNGPRAITVDPENPKRLYLSVYGRFQETGDVDGGIFLSTDRGQSWRNILSKDQHIYDVTLDPWNPKVLYACGFERAAWRSEDRGETWSRIPGYNYKRGHRVIPDLHHPGMIYITTFGGGVWYGPAKGDPNAGEDTLDLNFKEK